MMNDEQLREAYERGLPAHDGSPSLDDVSAERLRRLVEAEGNESERLRTLLGGRWNRRWLKKADKRPRKPKEKNPLPGGHASVYKLMQAAKQKRTEKS